MFNQILRVSSGALRSSPVVSLAVEAGELPLHLKVVETFTRRYLRLAEKPHFEHKHFHETATKIFKDETELDIPNIARVLWAGKTPWNFPRPKIDSSVRLAFKKGQNAGNARAIVKELQCGKYKEHSHVFTDGSKSGNETGLGVFNQTFQIEASLPAQCSVYSAEAAALAVAVENANDGPTVIFSDSASCIDAVNKGESKHPFIQRILQNARQKNITICWIPGHTGIPGNEAADRAAERGRSAPLLHSNVPVADLTRWIRQRLFDRYQHLWNDHRPTFLQRIKGNVGKWSDRADRKEQKVLTRCRIGHTKYTKAHLFDRLQSSLCETCQVELSIEHILLNCKKYDDIRDEIGISSNIEIALSNLKSEEQKLLKFLKKTNLYDMI